MMQGLIALFAIVAISIPFTSTRSWSQSSTSTLELDAGVTQEALAVSAIYRKANVTCADVLIDNIPGRIIELPSPQINDIGQVKLPISGLCMMKFTNVDNTRPLQVRLPVDFTNFAFLPDNTWTTTGAIIGPGQSVDVPMIISRLEQFEFLVESQLMAKDFEIHRTLVKGE